MLCTLLKRQDFSIGLGENQLRFGVSPGLADGAKWSIQPAHAGCHNLDEFRQRLSEILKAD